MEYKSAKLSKDLIVNKLHWDGQKVVKLADSTANYLLENWGNYNPFTVMDAHDAKYQAEVIDKQEQESIVKNTWIVSTKSMKTASTWHTTKTVPCT